MSSQERQDILESIQTQRNFLRQTVRGLSDDQCGLAPTASALTLMGIIKHVADTEESWADFMEHGDAAQDTGDSDNQGWSDFDADADDPRFTIEPGTTLASVLENYGAVAARTDALVETIDLDSSQALPPAPWFEAGARRSARRVLLHIVAETAQHSGDADIIRESIDGAKSMG